MNINLNYVFNRKQFICFFLFLPTLLFCQRTVNGIVKDTNNNFIEGANIIVKTKSNNTVAFRTSDSQGSFSIKINSGNFLLKISYLGYKTVSQNIEINNEDLILQPIILMESNTELDEVILKAENNGIVQKGDTTLYKIEKFLNGTEENLKDVINNLPGLNINEKGKITANGKEIDRLLIDGEDLYKRQHQLATNNVSSKMIKDIELIRNYKGFESIQQKEKTGLTALNVNIKDDFKNKFTGNLEVFRGVKDKGKINSPLFNFNKHIKFSLIVNSNNLGDAPMGIEDYFSLIDSDVRESNNRNSKVVFSNLEDLPRFLSSGINVKSKTNNFATLSTIFNPTDKIKIDFYSIFNNSNQKEIFYRNILLNPSINPIEINENNNVKERNFFGVFQLKSIYKANENTVLTLDTNLNLDNTKRINLIENTSINNSNFIEQKSNPKKLLFNSELSLKKNINSNILESNLYFKHVKNRNQNSINSNNEFLDLDFSNNPFFIDQSLKKESREAGFGINYTLNKTKIGIDIFTNTSLTSDKLVSNVINQTGFNNDLSQNNLLSSMGSNFTVKINQVLNYTIGLNYNYVSNKFNKSPNTSNYLGINSSFKAIFNNNNIGQLSYKFSSSIPTIDNLIEEYIIKDYRNLIINDDIKPNNLFPYHQLSFNHFIFKPKTKFSFIFNASYNFKEKSINNNIINSTNLTVSKNRITDQDQMFSTLLFFDKEFKKIPFSFSGSVSYNTTEKNFFESDIISPFKNENISSIIKIKTNFIKSLIHLDFGFKYSKDIYNNSNNESILLVQQPYFNLNGNIIKELFWNLNATYTNYNASNNKRDIFSLSPRLRFSKQKSSWEFNLIGNNILNLSNQNIIENNSGQSYFEQRVTSILDGYIIFGVKLKY